MFNNHPEGVTILHLSDIHRTPDEPVTNQNILAALTADLKRQQDEEGLPKPDFLVISGDITQAARPEEYDDAYELIHRLTEELTIPDFSRVILVPGNHDISWDLSEGVFKSGRQKPSGIDGALIHTEGSLFFWTDEELYIQRLEPFRAFYRRLYKREYGITRREQYDIWHYPEIDICFVGLNSCDRVDHLRFRGAIYEEALFAANKSLKEKVSTEHPHCIKIAVWHHDLNWLGRPGHEDNLDPAILGHLVTAGYDLALCGHTHRTNFNEYTYPGFRLPIVAAGSLCAGARQREESIPRCKYSVNPVQGVLDMTVVL
jgi:3',5'-cyclic AMP phosphodiesterase CpdA